ncbi:mitochondrial fission protein ELM1-like isoform X3 [Solanum dulcamara]|uniref:mitochondrial fission protein ELM1-like isoform X3 n=1 Tax=Solanum dulcamara TaxID=45834 RepID=UPI002486B334|nr:mitochondrial fission protein ELM1-like isoform X3 [Solanum dulcamara]
MRTISRVFIIGNGVPGAENQCFGLVRALGLSHRQTLFRVIRPKGGINKRLHWLPVSLHKRLENVRKLIYGDSFSTQIAVRGQKLMSLAAERQVSSDILEANAKHIATLSCEAFAKYVLDGPSLVVASGRDTISISSSIKQLAPGYVFTVQIQHPRSRLNRFDLVITPRHDYYPLTPEGQKQIPWLLRRWITPRTSPERHVDAAYTWHDELATLPRPLLVVNVGGPTGHCRYGTDLAMELTALLLNIVPTCGSIRVSFSRRTPCKVSDIIWKELGNHPKVHIWSGEGPNPHMGHLAFADAFVITADSVSMLSEACSTGKPVYVIGAEHCTWKFRDFHRSLKNRGVVRPFVGKEDISESWSYSPLNDTKEAAAHVIKALAVRGWRLPS